MTTLRNSVLALILKSSLSNAKDNDNSNDKNKENEEENESNACDEDSIPSSKSVSSLTPNSFHKICPPVLSESVSLGQPICGDGTAFSFFYTSPIQRFINKDKIIIEFLGGGACWDENTCNAQSGYLTFPENLNNFVGYSCSEAQYGMQDGANLLCNTQIGDVNFAEYNYLVVPYCTQDVHMGDMYTNLYNDGDGDGIYHHGAHNMMSVLQWVYKNFPNPSHIALTGCSAGGTALPVAYDLLYKHYNSFFSGGRSVNINVLMDSAVYLTPEYFMYNGLENWNVWTILKKTKFNLNKWKYNEMYSTKLWEHVLRRGSRRDRWGFLSHTSDDVSLAYLQAMSGNYNGDDDGGEDTDASQWYTQTMESLTEVTTAFKNVDSFFIDGDGHCTFGLYYGLQEDGFEEWASEIFREQQIFTRTAPSLPLFLMSLFFGVGLFFFASAAKRKSSEVDSSGLLETSNDEHENGQGEKKDNYEVKKDLKEQVNKSAKTKIYDTVISFAARFKSYPITSGYFMTTSLYLCCMILSGGFENPLDNPSLGPSASTMSSFGINNPTLIVYENQIFRLLTSTFLCSGILTYLMALHSVLRCIRHLECVIDNSEIFASACGVIMFSGNLFYAFCGEGASCSSMAFILGLNSFSISLSSKFRSEEVQIPCPWGLTVLQVILICVLFPFNSWIMVLPAMATGAALPFMLKMDTSSSKAGKPTIALNALLLLITIGFYLFLIILLLANVPRPDKMYKYPYLTGCDMKYSLEVDDIVDQFSNGEMRRLEKNEDENGGELCAQFCVPHLIRMPLSWSIRKYTDYSLLDGMCTDLGYETHMADKTYTYWGYSLDVELYALLESDDN